MTKRVVIIPGDEAARRLDNTVSAVYAQGQHLTPNQGGKGLTTEFCQAVKEHL